MLIVWGSRSARCARFYMPNPPRGPLGYKRYKAYTPSGVQATLPPVGPDLASLAAEEISMMRQANEPKEGYRYVAKAKVVDVGSGPLVMRTVVRDQVKYK